MIFRHESGLENLTRGLEYFEIDFFKVYCESMNRESNVYVYRILISTLVISMDIDIYP